jgi:hypothetical protein
MLQGVEVVDEALRDLGALYRFYHARPRTGYFIATW